MTVFSTQDKNKAMPQKKLLVIGLFSLTVALSGCATDGNYYRADVYSSSQVNQVGLILASWATSSRRSPGVRRRPA